MLHFKACPKCFTGTVEHNFDPHGEYAECLNCGYMRDIPEENTASNIGNVLAVWRAERQVTEQKTDGIFA